jgi:hypothetical protein
MLIRKHPLEKEYSLHKNYQAIRCLDNCRVRLSFFPFVNSDSDITHSYGKRLLDAIPEGKLDKYVKKTRDSRGAACTGARCLKPSTICLRRAYAVADPPSGHRRPHRRDLEPECCGGDGLPTDLPRKEAGMLHSPWKKGCLFAAKGLPC